MSLNFILNDFGAPSNSPVEPKTLQYPYNVSLDIAETGDGGGDHQDNPAIPNQHNSVMDERYL
ncbi:hypothetical protein BJ085DRAFT_39324 [Dimargaris cristalligena]|uniref:Uncharacterized protein n=1 Tax=Dimargaris cristalligena TaxID=215637 RepID=A0A4P9ZK76_9FUNG|nr:hypothetical protein BJ085DRAFT_39324 [Dimargaris cristalligena]|eukprot:RKP33666.1 hypothetical protein BJ085DRAFT_39324 [Dimargaris cristalligena]